MFTETIRTIRDGEPRAATSTFDTAPELSSEFRLLEQLLSSEFRRHKSVCVSLCVSVGSVIFISAILHPQHDCEN